MRLRAMSGGGGGGVARLSCPTAAAAVPVRGWSFAADASMAADAAAAAASDFGGGAAGSSGQSSCSPFHGCRPPVGDQLVEERSGRRRHPPRGTRVSQLSWQAPEVISLGGGGC